MKDAPKNQLMKAFNDPTFAWQLLQWEIAIEMNDSLSGQAIARLLQLYMRGVQKMNSLMDIRQAYFKNKVTSLMMKSTVVKTLNKAPMAKKEKPLEISARVEPTKAIKQNGQPRSAPKQEKQATLQATVQATNNMLLKEKKREMEMRLAYEAETSSQQNVNNIYNQYIKKEETVNNKVKGLLNDHDEKLKQRINRRKLKTSTFRSRPQDTSDAFPLEQMNNNKNETEESPVPGSHQANQQKCSKPKRYLSVDCKAIHDLTLVDSPRKIRKNTHDCMENSKNITGKGQEQGKNRFGENGKGKQQGNIVEGEQQLGSMAQGELERIIENRQSI